MNIKERIIDVFSHYEAGKYSNIALNDYFRENPNLPIKEKSFITEVFYGMIRKQMFLEYVLRTYTKKIEYPWLKNLLRLSLYQGLFMDSDEKGVVWEAVELTKNKYDKKVANFVNGVLRKIFREKNEIFNSLLNKKEYLLYSYPKWFYNKIKSDYPKNFKEILKTLKETPYLSIRINKLKYTEKEFLNLLNKLNIKILKQVDFVYYLSDGKILNTDEFKSGKLTVQDASSYIAAKNLNANKDDRILDACSAPGGKSMVIAESMNNTGEIISLDIHEHKIKLIKNNAENMGIKNVYPILHDARKINELNGEFDKILVDAPCSGFGVIRKKPEAIYNKTISNVEELARLQLDILNSASKKLKKGGILVYSTCTITKEENTANIRKFLETHSNFSVVETDIPKNVNFIKDKYNGINIFDNFLDAFYIIKLKKNS
ncbi:16S rRNA (cytosine967-C5)-methyltransferase [Hypnocyclicus thermotrophus]|uniref:16S rRNA (cytosine(967)-C(5))-methyltransferase n=1 Tax=Hypnocyclicus thermotrophus TaxID=1627895 RepID=A0AA46DXR9_9FUSO|nr:16S rRNA (cytosine(967)-C(5))-methyltransferase RsmB [Hypnocyclicus thermotrophus]TDT68643.1 16S rRNA (cytosine967-C5)-methyltransferase [Hypnocyclicus thermotrophus]